MWRHKHNTKFVVRFDDKLKGWVVDKDEFNRDIIAFRYGAYPTAVAKQREPDHILQLEQMLMNDMVDDVEEQKENGMESMKPKDQNLEMKSRDKNDGISGVKADELNAINDANRDDEKKSEEVQYANPLNPSQSVLVKSKEKRGLFCDGQWHIKGNVERSRIKVRGYTEKEFDLEWELRSTAAQYVH